MLAQILCVNEKDFKISYQIYWLLSLLMLFFRCLYFMTFPSSTAELFNCQLVFLTTSWSYS